jgi:ABC-2 type transport system ATP-binding protein
MIELTDLTKRYGDITAVDRLTFEVRPGEVTGFLGPNGAGKSTTLRMIVGLDAPTAGTATIEGRRYDDLRFPLRHVGALLEARAVHPGRTARDHLRWLADSNSIARERVEEVLDLVGLADAGDRRTGGYSLGMGQRLGVATALLGDPGTVILDEPVNGLDPEGIQWIRGLLRRLAAEGRTVLLSSHLMTEMALTADRLVVIGRGRLLAEGTVDEVVRRVATDQVRVASSDPDRLRRLLVAREAEAETEPDGQLVVTGLDARQVGITAHQAGIALYELSTNAASLEDAFFELTRGAADHTTREEAA